MARSSRNRGKGRGPGRAPPKEKLRTAKGRSVSSSRWLQRQLDDPYVARARAEGYRSRAAFKLLEMDERFRFLKRGATVVDLGAAPGGWSQVAVARGARVLAVDLSDFEPVTGAEHLTLDFLDEGADDTIREALGGPADVVMSDMAAPATGTPNVDHLRIMALCEAAADFAESVLAPGGCFLAKVLRGGGEGSLVAHLKRRFRSVRHVKPAASRADSAELYLLAMGFRGSDD
ncbi:MAG: RlmE family RNA methyltransferase [Alphaproteobacteria bacterium]|jgi:23S rRNA (uridine2552-2'-O)-methyltransferase|nr:RlmE family RNA methyltransferase [Alphaproteobacteria bacterium]